jgi:WD40 repeat protein
MGGSLWLWQMEDMELLREWEDPTGMVNSVAFSPDGALLVSVSSTSLELWRVADGKLLRIQTGYTEWVSSTAFSPEGAILASGTEDGRIWLYQAQQ